MNAGLCLMLDDYLAQDLGPQDQARFRAHLMECANCRQAVQEQERIDALLAEATARLVPVPVGLTQRIERRLQIARRRRIVGLTMALAASVLVVWLLHRPISQPRKTESNIAAVHPSLDAPAPTAQRVRVTFPRKTNVVAMPMKTESAHVTFIWVYQGLRATPPPALVIEESLPTSERNDL